MAGYIENSSLPIQPISDTQASILDMLLFPGFTRISTAVQGYLTVDLGAYLPLLCFFGLFVLACRRICKYLWGWLETYCTSTVHLRFRDEAYDIVMMWISSQSFTQNARSSLVTTDLASSLRSRSDRSNGRDANQKTLHYTPWNGRFFMWYKGRLLVFRREYRAGELSSREEASVSCIGRSPQILRELLSECCTEYVKLVRGKTCLYEQEDGTWTRSAVSNIRRTSTIILDKDKKKELLKDIGDFLDSASQQWYSDRGIPYRRGYLLYGPPGTGKSSLSMSIAGHFGLDIYILSLSTLNESNLKSLFAKLPSRCIILLEDIDAVSSNRDAETEDSRLIVTGSPSRMSQSASGKVSLSALLNVIDGVGSQEGRILIMTTNHITRLDRALIRPGRVDKKVELGLADSKMTADLFCLVFKPVKGDVAQPGEAERVERLAQRFAANVPELKFSPAEISSFLLQHRKSPEEAIENVEKLISTKKSKLPGISEDAKPEGTQHEIAQDFKWDEESSATALSSEMVQTPLAVQPTTPPSSNNLSPSKSFVTLSDPQELVKAVKDMQMASTHATKCACSHTPPEDPLEATSTDFCSLRTLCSTFLTSQPLAQIVTTEYVQQFIDIVKATVAMEIASTASASKLGCPDGQAPTQPVTIQDLEKLILELIGTKSDNASEISQAPRPNSSEDAPLKVEARASLLAFKEVNEVWDSKAYKYTVVEAPKSTKIDNLDKYVFVVRSRVDKKGERTTYYIDVKSHILRDALKKVLHDVPGISLKEENLSVERNVLYSFLADIKSCRNWNNIDPHDQLGKHLELLVDHLQSSYAHVTQRLNALLLGQEITYDLLWALFKANTLVYTTCQGTKKSRCIRYESGQEETSTSGLEYFHIKGNYLDFDGKILGKVPIETAILKFPGSKPISALDAFPLQYHGTKDAIIHELIVHGRRFCSLTGIQHRQYKGKAFQMKKGKPIEISIDGRIVVDAVMFQEVNPNYVRPSVFKSTTVIDGWEDSTNAQPNESTFRKGIDPNSLSDEDLLLCSPTVLGFTLVEQLWLEFAVADISDICWDETIFEQLTIPSNSKTLIQALATHQTTHTFDDFVTGKGRGLVITLYGPPGVGKTMTAEALSELLHRPLFTVSAANLSRDPKKLDAQLTETFDVADRWDALLLLDEADSFLSQRGNDQQHNSLVSVFLRKLEYYQGIMILTTNRVRDFDPAVQSRIHVGIPYGNLGLDTRKTIWDKFLKKGSIESEEAFYSASELQDLAEHNLNGRQIKNSVRAANALAAFDGKNLSIAHVQTVLDVGEVFENDFRGTGKIDNMNGYL